MESFESMSWLEEEETVLWTGRSSVGIAALRVLAILGLELGALYLGLRYVVSAETRSSALEQARRLAADQPVVLALLVVMAMMPLLGMFWRSVRDRYGITDRRLVAFRRNGQLFWALPPDLVLEVSRGSLLQAADVRFNWTIRRSGSESRNRRNAFRCMADAKRIVERVEAWMEERQEEVLESVRDRSPVASPLGHFTLQVPAGWQLRTYHLEKPSDASLLSPLSDDPVAADGDPVNPTAGGGRALPADPAAPWNTLVLLGPWRTALSIEAHAGAPPAGPEADDGSWQVRLVRLLGAEPLDREDAALGGLSGERVRWRLSGTRSAGPRRHRATFLLDQWTLRGDECWYRISAAWSEVLPKAETALREVVETFERRSGPDVVPVKSARTHPLG